MRSSYRLISVEFFAKQRRSLVDGHQTEPDILFPAPTCASQAM